VLHAENLPLTLAKAVYGGYVPAYSAKRISIQKGVPLMVYVINKYGQPLMPTERHGKVRRMLKSGEAKVVKRCPFTIQLLYDTTDFTQPVSLGIDAGSNHIGVSATTKTKVLYEADVTLRNDIVELLSTRREARKARRFRKTRYRKPRFANRKRPDNWLAPSVQQKVDTHLTVVRKVREMLPVSRITVEVASFDIQKIKNPDISGVEYQQGDQDIRRVGSLRAPSRPCRCYGQGTRTGRFYGIVIPGHKNA
jgi:N6-L-threonylcarbamoyladenine synthase